MMKRVYLVCGLALLAASCTRTSQVDRVEATFDCDGSARLSVTFENKAGAAVVRTQSGGLHVLTRTISGSGYSYESEGRALRGKGREAVWTDSGAKPLACREQRN
jgi:membrane-bound inhibitor of C-type lysozyme